MDEDELKKVIKYLSAHPPGRLRRLRTASTTSSAATGRASQSAPRRNPRYYEKYAAEHPDGPRTAQALYQAVYRQAVLTDMYAADGNDKKSRRGPQPRPRPRRAGSKTSFRSRTTPARAAALVYKLDQGVPVYGIDQRVSRRPVLLATVPPYIRRRLFERLHSVGSAGHC